MAFTKQIDMKYDKWAVGQGLSDEDRKRVGWGLGIGLQLNSQGEVTGAFHPGDMDQWRAFVAIDIRKREGTVYFSNSPNGLLLVDTIIKPNVEINDGLKYVFEKYGFARTIEDDWKNKQGERVTTIIAKYELHLAMHENKDKFTISMTCDPYFFNTFVDIIKNQLEEFKKKNNMEDGKCVLKPVSDKEGNIISLSIELPSKEKYEEFSKQLKEAKLTPPPEKFHITLEDGTDPSKKKISFSYNGLFESNKENLMLVVFPPDSENPTEISMKYDQATGQYKAVIETSDVCEKFIITTAKEIGAKENQQATVLQKGFISLKDGVLQPVNKIPGVPEGKLETYLLTKDGQLMKSSTMNNKSLQEGDRFVTVYFPHGYDPDRRPPYKIQLVLDGGQYLNPMQMNVTLDNLISTKEIEPVIAMFISPQSGPPKEEAKGFGLVMPEGYSLAMRLKEYCCNPEFADKLAKLPISMRQQFNVSNKKEDITIWGVSAGGLQAAYTGLLHPNIFGNVVAESPMSWNIPIQNGANWREGILDAKKAGEDITWSTSTARLPEIEGEHREHITKMVQTGHDSISGRKLDTSTPIRFYLDAGSRESEYDPRLEVGSANLLAGARVFADAAMDKGHTIVDNSVHVIPDGGHLNMTWMRNQAAIIRSMHCSPELNLEKKSVNEDKQGASQADIYSGLAKPIHTSPSQLARDHKSSIKQDLVESSKVEKAKEIITTSLISPLETPKSEDAKEQSRDSKQDGYRPRK